MSVCSLALKLQATLSLVLSIHKCIRYVQARQCSTQGGGCQRKFSLTTSRQRSSSGRISGLGLIMPALSMQQAWSSPGAFT